MTIYLLAPKPETPSGGVWFLGKLAELLNQIGHEAYIWTPKPFSVYWAANPIDQKLIKTEISIGQGDTMIVPEVLFPLADHPGVRQVCLLQNYVWLRQDLVTPSDQILVVSRFLANWTRRMLYIDPVGKVTPFLEEGVWAPSPKESNRTLVFARRNPYHAKMRDALEAAGFPVEYVTENLTQRQISEKLSRCEFYVHLTHPEGFPIAWLEAMRSGTIVVGTTGGGGNEIATDRETGMIVQDPENGRYGSADHFAGLIMERMNELRADADLRSRLWQAGYQWSLRYTAEATKVELKEIFG